jgi:hypothetical protein
VAVERTESATLAAAGLLAAGKADEQGGQSGISAWQGHAQLAGLVQRAVADHDVGL